MRRLNLCRLFAPLALATAAFSHAQVVQLAQTLEVAPIKPSPPLDMAKAGWRVIRQPTDYSAAPNVTNSTTVMIYMEEKPRSSAGGRTTPRHNW
jgi:hypothetical protein